MRIFKPSKQLLLIALMAFTLLGVQVIQASPDHDHAQHELDCAWCHFELNDDIASSSGDGCSLFEASRVYHAVLKHLVVSQASSLYNIRAPPYVFL